MDLFEREDLRRLAQAEDGVCISLYMTTTRYEADLAQNIIRYKNLLKRVREQLRSRGYRENEGDEILTSAYRHLDNTSFWRRMGDGLAVFITPESTDFYRLPLEFKEVAVVGRQFHLKPLFPLMATNNRFYVLGLSKNDVRLYQGTHYALSEVSSTNIPSNIVEAILQYEDPEKQIQQHTAKRTVRGRQDAAFHGHGSTSDDASAQPKDELKRFFRKVDESLREQLRDEEAPLVLASVKEYLSYYRDISQYPRLVEDQSVTGNPEHLKLEELHEKAWAIVEPLFLKAQAESVERFNELYHTDDGLASDDFHEIIPAAVYSRIDTLFVPVGHHRWGRYDAARNSVELHDEQQPGDEDLLNYAAVHAHLNGATVHALRPEKMPNGVSLAATFRYAADVTASEHG